MRIVPLLVSVALTVSLVGPGGGGLTAAANAQAPESQPGGGPPAQLVERARQDLARRLGVSGAQVTVAESAPMTWSSLALGCPAPGLAYGAAETPGFRIGLDVLGQRFTYHTDTRETFVACVQGQAIPDPQVLGAGGLLAALLERGVQVEVADAYAELPFLHADGTRYRLSVPGMPAGSEVQVYDYRDPAVLAADVAQIGSDGQPTAGAVEWSRPPIFFRSGGVLALTFDGARPLVAVLTELLGEPFAGADGIGMPPPTGGSPPPSASPPPAGPPPAPPPSGSGPPSSMLPTDPSVQRVTWDEAKGLITGGMVTQAFQTHALEVRLNLKDGTSVVTTEPRIDEVFRVIRECGAPCSSIMIATE
jgi:hypothetical protein